MICISVHEFKKWIQMCINNIMEITHKIEYTENTIIIPCREKTLSFESEECAEVGEQWIDFDDSVFFHCSCHIKISPFILS